MAEDNRQSKLAIYRQELSKEDRQRLNLTDDYASYYIDWRPFKEKVQELIDLGAPITFTDFQIWVETKLGSVECKEEEYSTTDQYPVYNLLVKEKK